MLKKLTKNALYRFGYRLTHINNPGTGVDPFSDFKRFLGPKERPTIFDVGANTGQSIEWFKRVWPAAVMHSFEPSPETFQNLKANASSYSDVHLNNAALGKEIAKMTLLENTDSSMSSLLEPGPYAWGKPKSTTEIDVATIDDYCTTRGITEIDILKIDTQGYEYEVLQGAAQVLEQNRVRLIFLELIFSEQYKNIVPADKTIGLLREAGFKLVTIYDQFYQDDILSWTDALFHNSNPIVKLGNGQQT